MVSVMRRVGMGKRTQGPRGEWRLFSSVVCIGSLSNAGDVDSEVRIHF